MHETIYAKGKIFELVHVEQPDGRIFEMARRAPGTRIIIHDTEQDKILLTREFRRELGEWDYRLPGGKVFDTLDEFEAFRASGDDIVEAAKRQAIREAQQETGIEVTELQLYDTSVLGATVEWDLYVFVADAWQTSVDGQELETGEEIEADRWVTHDEAETMIIDGLMQEDRIEMVLLRWLKTKGDSRNVRQTAR